jgi:CheY-like chemotaxis protein
MNRKLGKNSAIRILVVEDDPLVSAMAEDALTYAGFEVTAVAAAEDALGLALMDVPFDLIFTDIDLAGHIDGFELADMLREMCPRMPIIYASARAVDTVALVPDSVFLSKPYSPLALCTLIRQMVAEHRHTVDIAPAAKRELHEVIDFERHRLRA